MKYSSLKYSSFSWTAIPIYNRAEAAIDASVSMNILTITNLSGSDRVYSVNQGPPFPVPSGTSRTYDLFANGEGRPSFTIEYAAATLNAHYVDGV